MPSNRTEQKGNPHTMSSRILAIVSRKVVAEITTAGHTTDSAHSPKKMLAAMGGMETMLKLIMIPR